MKNFWNDGRSFWVNCVAFIFAIALILGIALRFWIEFKLRRLPEIRKLKKI